MLTMWTLPCPSPPGKTDRSLPWVPCIWEEVAGRKTRGAVTLCLLPRSALRWQNFSFRWGFTDLAEARVPAIHIPLANSCHLWTIYLRPSDEHPGIELICPLNLCPFAVLETGTIIPRTPGTNNLTGALTSSSWASGDTAAATGLEVPRKCYWRQAHCETPSKPRSPPGHILSFHPSNKYPKIHLGILSLLPTLHNP